MGEIVLGTLLEQNKAIIRQQPLPLEEELQKMRQRVSAYFLAKGEEYYMLYCKELSDFTILHFGEKASIGQGAREIDLCIGSRGKLFSIDPTQDGIALEIWIIDYDNEPRCYYLFPYTEAVIEVEAT